MKEEKMPVDAYKRLKSLEERIEFVERKLDNLTNMVKKSTMPERHYKD